MKVLVLGSTICILQLQEDAASLGEEKGGCGLGLLDIYPFYFVL